MEIFYYSGTHWDREWYQTFQGFRKRLVEMTDDLIAGLETLPDYGVFHFDGQTIVLEDYLEIRPEMRDRLTALIRAGKIVIGPWYNMPDEFLISGESMIKNLKTGMALSRAFGVEPCKNAYICDIFGHSAQTPQIFAGMGLSHTVLGRGTNDGDDPAHFLWEALDGTQVAVFKLCDRNGYGDITRYIQDSISTDLPDEELDRLIKDYTDAEIRRTGIPLILLMDALDHIPMRKDTGRILASLRRVYPGAKVHHCSIDEFGRAQDAYRASLAVRKGELCEPARIHYSYNHVITNTLSSRYPLKQYNDRNQTRLEKRCAPLYALGRTDMAIGFLNLANRYLLQNHPHDSICGCSIDQVHKDMIYRFDQTRQLCDEIENDFLRTLRGDLSGEAESVAAVTGDRILRVYNPLPYRITRTVTARVDLSALPTYREPFGYEKIPTFRLYDSEGKEIVYGYVRAYGRGSYEIAFEATLMPAGVTEFALCGSDKPTRHPSRLLTSPRSAAGDHVSIAVNGDGTVDLCDLSTGETYRNLLTLIDDGEIGDGWFHCTPNIDTAVTPNAAEIAVTENSAVRVTFRITQKMELPKYTTEGDLRMRSEETVPFRVTHEVTLARSDRGITVHTYLDNNACDHRLRLRLPAVVSGETYEASQAFGYVTRRCGDDPATADYREYKWADRNMAGICAKRSKGRGLAFVSAHGLHECGVWENGDMDVTLFRAFRKTVRTAGEPGGQLLGRLDFTYRILPFAQEDAFADLQKEQDILAVGIDSCTVGGGNLAVYRPSFALSGRSAVYSTANPLTDGACEIRIYNDSDRADTAQLLLPAFAKRAALTELDGRVIAPLSVKDGTVTLDLPPFRIVTVRCTCGAVMNACGAL